MTPTLIALGQVVGAILVAFLIEATRNRRKDQR